MTKTSGLVASTIAQEWDVDFLAYVKGLEKIKPVVFCGDLNVAHTEIDLANPKTNRKNAGFTDEERSRFDAIVEAWLCRQLSPPLPQYHRTLYLVVLPCRSA